MWNFEVKYEIPAGYARVKAGTTIENAKAFASDLLDAERAVVIVRVPGFKYAVYAKV